MWARRARRRLRRAARLRALRGRWAALSRFAAQTRLVPAAGACAFALALLGARWLATGTLSFRFMAWNVFLAWLPALLGATGLWLVTLPLAACGAVGLYALLVGGAEGLLRRREPDLLARVLGDA